MKKITTLVILAFAGINFAAAQAPALFGTCYSGGTMGYGTIFQADMHGSNLHAVYSFLNPEGAMPWGKIAQAPSGKIYGVTFLGGCVDSCTLYEYDPIAHTCVDVHDFYCNPPYSGEPSQGGLIILPDGNLYGTAQLGGNQNLGTAFELSPDGTVKVLHNFHGLKDGAVPFAGLFRDQDGHLYGTAFKNFLIQIDQGGNVFEITP